MANQSSAPHNDAPESNDASLAPELITLAHHYGVATEYWDWQGRYTPISRSTVLQVLRALGVDADTPQQVAQALVDLDEKPWRQVLPDIVVARQANVTPFNVHIADGGQISVWVDFEAGGRHELAVQEQTVATKEIDGTPIEKRTFVVPANLPLGWHRLHVRHAQGTAETALVITPTALELPAALRENRAWGLMAQLYSIRSHHSWGLGDLADLDELAAWSATEHGAGYLMVNPLQAAEPIAPMSASPYLPTSRRFFNPMYLRVEQIPEVAYLSASDRSLIEWQGEAMRATNTSPALLDRDAVWQAKRTALELIYLQPRSRGRQAEFERFCQREGSGLLDYATWCAIAERYGADTSQWPQPLQAARSAAVEQIRLDLADRVQFHMWLQWCLDDQLATTQRHAKEAGMSIGILHDFPVGVNAHGSDAWALADVLAADVTVGAPPDAFNQQGQDWGQPPLRPDRLAQESYLPLRDMVRTVLRHAGGLRIDHIIGMFRMWWVPKGVTPDQGTYVRYDNEAMIGILALEAHRVGAILVGEDLGTVEPWARDYMRERGLLGTSILWFERDGDAPRPPEQWRELCQATVTSHDLPPTAGHLRHEHVKLRSELGQLTRSFEEEAAVDKQEQLSVIDELVRLDLLAKTDQDDEVAVIKALHRFLCLTPSKLIGVMLPDLVGEHRTMNLPGTFQEYPNWQLPLADGSGRVVSVEELMNSQRAADLLGVLCKNR